MYVFIYISVKVEALFGSMSKGLIIPTRIYKLYTSSVAISRVGNPDNTTIYAHQKQFSNYQQKRRNDDIEK